MIFRLGFIVAASIAVYAFQQFYDRKSKSIAQDDLPENGEAISEKLQNENENENGDEENHMNAHNGLKEVITLQAEEEEEKEEVKLINGDINPCTSSGSNVEDKLYPEIQSLLSGEIDTPLLADTYDMSSNINAEKENIYENEMANNANELEKLRYLVKELEEREVKLEGDLLQYHGLKEQELSISELEKQLKIKEVEIDMLKITINSLQAERIKLQEEVSQGVVAKKELEMARKKIQQLGTQIQLEANQTKVQLLLLKQQFNGLQAKEDESLNNKDSEIEKKLRAAKELEVEVMELKRKNKELQHDRRELVIKLDAAESKIKSLSNKTEAENEAKMREEANNLRHANDDLVKQVEGLQMNRFSEVEELVYLRWVNACLRFELRNYQTPSRKTSARDLKESLSPKSQERAKELLLEYAESERGGGDTDTESNFDNTSVDSDDFDNISVDSSMSRFSNLSKKPSLIQKIKKWGKNKDGLSTFSSPARSIDGSPMNPKKRGPLESLMLRNASDGVAITSFGTADHNDVNLLSNVSTSFQLMSKSVEGVLDEKYPAYKDRHKLALEREKQLKERAEKARAVKFDCGDSLKEESNKLVSLPPKLALIKEKKSVTVSGESNKQSCDDKVDSQTVNKIKLAEIEKRAPRIPRPPPKLSAAPVSNSSVSIRPPSLSFPPKPPPPPPGSLVTGAGDGDKVHRAPELVEFYQSLVKREARKETSPLIASSTDTSIARSNMIGEIENKSNFLMAVKADVETQGDFIQSLAIEVRAASFTKIEDLVAFVNWLDEELSFLADERAVLKHFDWPEAKADALREAAFEYQDLMKLEKQVSSFSDDQNLPCEAAMKKMYKLLEKVEQSVYALLRTRDMAVSRYKEFGIPTDWLLDSGTVGKIKLSSVQLARKYMKRVVTELDAMKETEKEPNKEFLILQGVRFAFRVHQFAGGFDADSMKAFEELRSRAHTLGGEENKAETRGM